MVFFLSPAAGDHPLVPGRISAFCSSLLDTSMSQFLINEESLNPSKETHSEAEKRTKLAIINIIIIIQICFLKIYFYLIVISLNFAVNFIYLFLLSALVLELLKKKIYTKSFNFLSFTNYT